MSDTENKVVKLNDLSIVKNYVDNKESTINQKIEEVKSIAKGRATGYVFDTVEDLDLWLQDEANTQKLVLGDNFYIRALDVPDYWWDGTQKQELETQKVDLTNYVKKTDFASENNAGVMKIWTTTETDGSLTLNISTEV